MVWGQIAWTHVLTLLSVYVILDKFSNFFFFCASVFPFLKVDVSVRILLQRMESTLANINGKQESNKLQGIA